MTKTPIKIACSRCGSDNVHKDAAAAWCAETQEWELSSTHDSETCNDCGSEGDYFALRIEHQAEPSDGVPFAWERAQFDGNTLLNPRDRRLPLWSSTRFDPPAIGSIVVTNGLVTHRCKITGYRVAEGWLMAVGYRIEEPSHKGDLAGIEIEAIEELAA